MQRRDAKSDIYGVWWCTGKGASEPMNIVQTSRAGNMSDEATNMTTGRESENGGVDCDARREVHEGGARA